MLNFGWTIEKGLIEATAIEVTDMVLANAKGNQRLFRYETEITKIGGMKPLIIIDTEKKLAYFLKDTDFNSDIIRFESVGVKLAYCREI